MNLTKNISNLLNRGTTVVSFSYGFKRRNVIIGANCASALKAPWGKPVNKALVMHNGEFYLFGRVMNSKGSKVRCFKVGEIYNPSPILCG